MCDGKQKKKLAGGLACVEFRVGGRADTRGNRCILAYYITYQLSFAYDTIALIASNIIAAQCIFIMAASFSSRTTWQRAVASLRAWAAATHDD
jgi:hypothetical protein